MPGCTRLVCLDKLKGNCETHTSCLEPDSLTVAPLKDFRYERASVVASQSRDVMLQSRGRKGVGFGVG